MEALWITTHLPSQQPARFLVLGKQLGKTTPQTRRKLGYISHVYVRVLTCSSYTARLGAILTFWARYRGRMTSISKPFSAAEWLRIQAGRNISIDILQRRVQPCATTQGCKQASRRCTRLQQLFSLASSRSSPSSLALLFPPPTSGVQKRASCSAMYHGCVSDSQFTSRQELCPLFLFLQHPCRKMIFWVTNLKGTVGQYPL